MITQAQRNAALLAAYSEVQNIIGHFVPAMFRGFAETYLQANPHLIASLSDACLNAADKVAVSVVIPSSIIAAAAVTPIVLPEVTNVQHPSTS